MITRRTMALALGLCPVAAAPFRARPAAAAGDPSAPIAALLDGLRAAMNSGKSTPFPQRYAALDPIIEQAFNLPQILQTSVGLRWRDLPPDQQSKLLDVFTRYTVASYVAAFDAPGAQFTLLPERRTSGADQIVETQIAPPNGAPTRIDYVMRQDGGAWKAVDVLLTGSISRVAVQRSDFRQLIETGDASRLIKSLEQKVADLSGHTMSA